MSVWKKQIHTSYFTNHHAESDTFSRELPFVGIYLCIFARHSAVVGFHSVCLLLFCHLCSQIFPQLPLEELRRTTKPMSTKGSLRSDRSLLLFRDHPAAADCLQEVRRRAEGDLRASEDQPQDGQAANGQEVVRARLQRE